jgi:hypothetical protein
MIDTTITRYQTQLTGPPLDRIDIRLMVVPIDDERRSVRTSRKP